MSIKSSKSVSKQVRSGKSKVSGTKKLKKPSDSLTLFELKEALTLAQLQGTEYELLGYLFTNHPEEGRYIARTAIECGIFPVEEIEMTEKDHNRLRYFVRLFLSGTDKQKKFARYRLIYDYGFDDDYTPLDPGNEPNIRRSK